jgi:hypothetical protein
MPVKLPMPVNLKASWERMRTGRVRILWLVLGALLLVSALPIALYHRQVLNLSQEKLVDTDTVQHNKLTPSLTKEIEPFETNLPHRRNRATGTSAANPAENP